MSESASQPPSETGSGRLAVQVIASFGLLFLNVGVFYGAFATIMSSASCGPADDGGICSAGTQQAVVWVAVGNAVLTVILLGRAWFGRDRPFWLCVAYAPTLIICGSCCAQGWMR